MKYRKIISKTVIQVLLTDLYHTLSYTKTLPLNKLPCSDPSFADINFTKEQCYTSGWGLLSFGSKFETIRRSKAFLSTFCFLYLFLWKLRKMASCWLSVGFLLAFCYFLFPFCLLSVSILCAFCSHSVGFLFTFCLFSVHILFTFCSHSVYLLLKILFTFCFHSVNFLLPF